MSKQSSTKSSMLQSLLDSDREGNIQKLTRLIQNSAEEAEANLQSDSLTEESKTVAPKRKRKIIPPISEEGDDALVVSSDEDNVPLTKKLVKNPDHEPKGQLASKQARKKEEDPESNEKDEKEPTWTKTKSVLEKTAIEKDKIKPKSKPKKSSKIRIQSTTEEWTASAQHMVERLTDPASYMPAGKKVDSSMSARSSGQVMILRFLNWFVDYNKIHSGYTQTLAFKELVGNYRTIVRRLHLTIRDPENDIPSESTLRNYLSIYNHLLTIGCTHGEYRPIHDVWFSLQIIPARKAIVMIDNSFALEIFQECIQDPILFRQVNQNRAGFLSIILQFYRRKLRRNTDAVMDPDGSESVSMPSASGSAHEIGLDVDYTSSLSSHSRSSSPIPSLMGMVPITTNVPTAIRPAILSSIPEESPMDITIRTLYTESDMCSFTVTTSDKSTVKLHSMVIRNRLPQLWSQTSVTQNFESACDSKTWDEFRSLLYLRKRPSIPFSDSFNHIIREAHAAHLVVDLDQISPVTMNDVDYLRQLLDKTAFQEAIRVLLSRDGSLLFPDPESITLFIKSVS